MKDYRPYRCTTSYLVSWDGRTERVFARDSYDAICVARELYGPMGVVGCRNEPSFS